MSKTEINFLSTIVFKVYKKLETKPYVKPTGRQSESEYSVNLRLNTHRNDVWRTDDPTCDKHF